MTPINPDFSGGGAAWDAGHVRARDPRRSADKDAARERARVAREARAGRARSLRRRVISGAVALFVAAWLVIAIVLISGNDPALSKRSATVASSSAAPTTSVSSSASNTGATASNSASSGTSSNSASSGTSSSSNNSSSGTAGSVTTRAS
jgi:hypothetical protein